MNRTTLAAIAATLLSAGTISACGGSSRHSGAASTRTTSANAATGSGVDRAFAAEMIPHHVSAVAMARIALDRGQSAFVKQLAARIISTQQAELVRLRAADASLAKAGVKTGDLGVAHSMMGMDDDPAQLKTASPFDAAFLAMMIPHHQGALVMAKAELARGASTPLRALATAIIAGQTKEIAQMRAHAHTGSGGAMPSAGSMDSSG